MIIYIVRFFNLLKQGRIFLIINDLMLLFYT
jgi:hypothetical protein